jgi:DNA-binding FadR family transcriptional regulator
MTQTDAAGLPAFRTARRAGLIDQVIDQLRGQITRGTWKIGDRIPTEAELAQLTGTSRNTVREAVQSLVHAGLLERRQGSGTYVLADSELAGAVSRRLADAPAVHVLEVRRTLEVGAARLAAFRRTDEDISRMRRLLSDRNDTIRDGRLDEAVILDVALHRAIGQAAHNPVLTDLYDNLLSALQKNVRGNVVALGGFDEDDHAALINAIAAGDGERAAVEAAGFLDRLLQQTPPPPPPDSTA